VCTFIKLYFWVIIPYHQITKKRVKNKIKYLLYIYIYIYIKILLLEKIGTQKSYFL